MAEAAEGGSVRMVEHYVFCWGNNEKRRTLKGRTCRIVSSGAMGSCLVEFENGQREIVSRRALRKAKP